MDRAAGGDDTLPAHGIVALPIGNHAAGAFDDRDKRHQIPRVHDRIAHNIGATDRHHIVAVTIAPIVVPLDTAGEGVKGRSILVGMDHRGGAAEQDRIFHPLTGADVDAAAIEPTLPPPSRRENR